jgi:hypothetical protein
VAAALASVQALSTQTGRKGIPYGTVVLLHCVVIWFVVRLIFFSFFSHFLVPWSHAVDYEEDDDSVTEMTPNEFVEALVHIVKSKHFKLNAIVSTTNNSSASSATQIKSGSFGLAMRMRRIIEELILRKAMGAPREDQESGFFAFHEQVMGSIECRQVFDKYKRKLCSLYEQFANPQLYQTQICRTEEPVQMTQRSRRKMLNLSGFVTFLKQFELLKDEFLTLKDLQLVLCEILHIENEGIKLEEAYRMAVASSSTSGGSNSSCSSSSSSGGSLHKTTSAVKEEEEEEEEASASSEKEQELLLTYPEFCEILAAVVLYHDPDPFVPLFLKLEHFFIDRMAFYA